jgi:hypothetical protein
MFETEVAAPPTELQDIGRRVAIIAWFVKDVVWRLALSFGAPDKTTAFFAISFIAHVSKNLTSRYCEQQETAKTPLGTVP